MKRRTFGLNFFICEPIFKMFNTKQTLHGNISAKFHPPYRHVIYHLIYFKTVYENFQYFQKLVINICKNNIKNYKNCMYEHFFINFNLNILV